MEPGVADDPAKVAGNNANCLPSFLLTTSEPGYASTPSPSVTPGFAAGLVWCGWVCTDRVGVCVDHRVVGYLGGVAICVGPQWHQQLPGGLAARQRRRLSHRPVLHLCQPNDGYLTVGQTLTPRCLNVTYTGTNTGSTFTDPLTSIDGVHWYRTDPAKVYLANGGVEIVPDNTWQQYGENQPISFVNRSVEVEAAQEPGPNRGMYISVKVNSSTTEGYAKALGW